MRSYFKQIIYNILELVSSILNLTCAFGYYYPKLQLGISYLVWLEARARRKELQGHYAKREESIRGAYDIVMDRIEDFAKEEKEVQKAIREEEQNEQWDK